MLPGFRHLVAGAAVVVACAGAAWAQGSEPRLLIPTPGAPGASAPSATMSPPPSSPGFSGSSAAVPGTAIPSAIPPPPSPVTARLEVRMSQLEQDLRSVTGRLEDVSYQLRKLDDRLDKLASDVEYRLSQVKAGDAAAAGEASRPDAPAAGPVAAGGGAVAATPRVAASASSNAGTPAAASASQTAALEPGSARDQYARAFAAMEKHNYDDAATGFAAFLKAHPDDPLADNARYWLGESFYTRGEYAAAAERFLDAYEKNKTGPKAPDTLLKLGLSLAGLDKKKEACASFRELNRAFPKASGAIKDRASQEAKRLACS